MKILIFGLPGSGETTFSKELIKDEDCCYFNAMKYVRYIMIGIFLNG